MRFNRALWAFRATFALIVLALLAVILRPAHAGRAPVPARAPQVATARGFTAQGVPIAMRFDRPGHPVAFDTRLRGRCTYGNLWSFGWWPADGDPVPFHHAGSALRVVQIVDRTFADGPFGQVVLSMRATVARGDTQVSGWMRMSATFYYPNGPTVCDSGRVPFAVGATSARPS